MDAEELSEIAFKLQKDISYFYTGATTSLPVKLSGSIIYRRGDNSLSDLERQQTDLAIEGFKKFARKALTSVNPEHD